MPELPKMKPLRREMPSDVVKEQGDISKITNELTDFWAKDSNDLPFAILEIRELLEKHKLPREAMPQVFKHAYDKLNKPMTADGAKETVRQMIDLVRSQKDPALRVHISALMAHEIQQDYQVELADKYLDTEKQGGQGMQQLLEKMQAAFFKRYAFEQFEADEQVSASERAFAKYLLDPKEGGKQFLNDHPLADLLKPARFLTEEEVLSAGAIARGAEAGPLQFSGNRVRLPVGHMPSVEKVEEYERRTSRVPAVSLAYQEGEKRFYVDLPQDLTRRALKDMYKVREGTMTRDVANADLEVIMLEFLQSMPAEQQAEMAERIGVNLELRFTTERNKRKSEATITMIRDIMDEVHAELDHLAKIKKMLENRLSEEKKKAA